MTPAPLAEAVNRLRKECNRRIAAATRAAYREGPNEPVVNPPVPFAEVNRMLKLCDAVFAASDAGSTTRSGAAGVPAGWISASQALPRHRYMAAFRAPLSERWEIGGPGSFRDGVFHNYLSAWGRMELAFHLPPIDDAARATTPSPDASPDSDLARVRAANPVAKNDCPGCHGLGTVLLSGHAEMQLCRVPGCPALERAR